MIVVLEGVNSTGKATQSAMLAEYARSHGLPAEVLDFPHYQTEIGQRIRQIVQREHDPLELQAYMTANRYEFSSRLVAAASDKNRLLVLDRYWPSGVAFGAAAGLDEALLVEMHRLLPQPDVCIFIDVPEAERWRRRPERRDVHEKDRGLEDRARAIYLRLFSDRGWSVVDGVGTREEVGERIRSAVRLHVGGVF